MLWGPGEAPLTYCLCCQDLPPCPSVTPRLIGSLPSGAVSAATWSFSACSDLTPCLLPDDSQCVLSLLPRQPGAASHLLLCCDVGSLSSAWSVRRAALSSLPVGAFAWEEVSLESTDFMCLILECTLAFTRLDMRSWSGTGASESQCPLHKGGIVIHVSQGYLK